MHSHGDGASNALLPPTMPIPSLNTSCHSSIAELPSCSSPNYFCKNASSDWPVGRAQRPQSTALRFGNDGRLPIAAWWPPPCDDTATAAVERQAYADAGFTLMVAVEGEMRKGRSPGSEALTRNLLACVDRVHALGMLSLVDGYVEIHHEGWGGTQTREGRVVRMDEDAFDPSVAESRPLRKPSTPEVRWLAPQLASHPGVAGLLISDDSVDLHANELEALEWMRSHTPQVLPWINQIGDPSMTSWPARAGYPYAMPELYQVTGEWPAHGGAAQLLHALEEWGAAAAR